MKNILIVEDDINIQKLIEKGIHNVFEKANVKKTTNAKEAMEISMEFHIDIFILDIELIGDCNGMDFACELRKIERYGYSPIIFETSFEEHKLSMYENVNCQTFLIKPFGEKQVEEAIIKAMDLSNALRKTTREIRIKADVGYTSYDVNNIVYIKSKEKYVKIAQYNEINEKLVEGSLIRYTLKKILVDINNDNFIMCHKSYIVNKEYIKKIRWNENKILLKCSDDIKIPLGDKYKKNLEQE